MYRVEFVPVIEPTDEDVRVPKKVPKSTDLAHFLHTKRHCWCDNAANASFQMGLLHPFYVVEITVAKWDDGNARNKALLKQTPSGLRPIFRAEDGKVYNRANASTTTLHEDEVEELWEERERMQRIVHGGREEEK